MRRFRLTQTLLLLVLALPVAMPAMAQLDRPTGLQPLPEPPPPPPGYQPDAALEPQVTITTRGEDRIEEYRVGGKLYMIKVTPSHGVPYYMVDSKGDGKFSRQESLDSGLRVPQWVIGTF